MPEPVILKDLPATFPEKDRYKKPSVIGSIVFHGLVIFVVIIVPLLIPQTIPERELIVTLVSPIRPLHPFWHRRHRPRHHRRLLVQRSLLRRYQYVSAEL